MSLINQMLNDLEQRNVASAGAGSLAGEVRSVQGMRASRGAQKIIPAVLLLLLVGGGVWWWKLQAPTPAVAPPPPVVPAPAPVVVPAPAPVVPVAVEPAPADAAVVAAVTPRLPGLETELHTVPLIAPVSAVPEKKTKPPLPAAAEDTLAPPMAAIEGKLKEKKTKAVSEAPIKSMTPQQKSDNLYKQAVSMMQQGRVAEARDALAQSLAENSANHNARQLLVGMLVDGKHASEAINVLQDGVRLAPEQTGFVMALARLQVETGERKAGLQTLEQGAKYAADDAEYHGFYAALLQRDNQHEEAIAHYLTALRADPANTSWLVGVGISLQAQGKYADAREAFERARQVEQLSPEVAAFVDQRLRQLKGK